MKYTTFILEKLPLHIGYANSKFDDDKNAARAKCSKLLDEIAKLKEALIAKKIYELEQAEPLNSLPSVPNTNIDDIQFPSVPKN